MCDRWSVSHANDCHSLHAPHNIPSIHQYLVEMAVIRLEVTARSILLNCMQDNDDVAPARSTIARQQNAAISNGVNRVAQVGIFSADAVEIVTEMMIFGETLRVIGERAVLTAERKIEACREGKRRQFERRWNLKGRIEMSGSRKFG